MDKKKEALAIKLNLEFDEVVDLFSEETLSSMEQDDLLGGLQLFCQDCTIFGNCFGSCIVINPTPAPTSAPTEPPTAPPTTPHPAGW